MRSVFFLINQTLFHLHVFHVTYAAERRMSPNCLTSPRSHPESHLIVRVIGQASNFFNKDVKFDLCVCGVLVYPKKGIFGIVKIDLLYICGYAMCTNPDHHFIYVCLWHHIIHIHMGVLEV